MRCKTICRPPNSERVDGFIAQHPTRRPDLPQGCLKLWWLLSVAHAVHFTNCPGIPSRGPRKHESGRSANLQTRDRACKSTMLFFFGFAQVISARKAWLAWTTYHARSHAIADVGVGHDAPDQPTAFHVEFVVDTAVEDKIVRVWIRTSGTSDESDF